MPLSSKMPAPVEGRLSSFPGFLTNVVSDVSEQTNNLSSPLTGYCYKLMASAVFLVFFLLAQLTGMTMFTVSRLLAKWDEKGIVSAGRVQLAWKIVGAITTAYDEMGSVTAMSTR